MIHNSLDISFILLAIRTAGQHSLVLQEKLSRNPLKMNAPEKVLSQAYGQARNIADFLHENGEPST